MTNPSTIDRLSQRIRLAVGQRLLLGLAPALLAVVVVVALAYYGELGRQAPEFVVAGAAVLALTSLVLTWRNTQYVVRRLRRLGRLDERTDRDDSTTPLDDLDRIEREVTRLQAALQHSNAEARDERARHARQLHEQATMLAATVRGASAQLDEVRLPLHILLDARFGILNENQEELLVAARTGAEGLDAAMRRLATVADADRGALTVRLEPVSVNDVVRAVMPMVRASAERHGVRLIVELEPALPRAWADRAALAEAVALLATRLIESLASPALVTLRTGHTTSHCMVRLEPVVERDTSLDLVATRLLHAQGILVEVQDGAVQLRVPRRSP